MQNEIASRLGKESMDAINRQYEYEKFVQKLNRVLPLLTYILICIIVSCLGYAVGSRYLIVREHLPYESESDSLYT